MLQIQIKDYNEFKSIFGTRANGGRIMNKILLSFWKYRFKIDEDKRSASTIRSVDALFNLVVADLNCKALETCTRLKILNYNLPTPVYYIDVHDMGIDMNDKRIVVLRKRGDTRKYPMKAGKLFRTILNDCGCRLDESTAIYCSEVFQQKWEAYSGEFSDNLTLHVDKHFDYIYDQYHLEGNFGSCMVGRNRHRFYEMAVTASAAYLTNRNNKIVARCIIFHNVKDAQGKLHNYAERQYSSNGAEFLKRILIHKLIQEGHIDLYKVIGAGCRDVGAVVNADGVRLTNSRLEIPCSLHLHSILSFMDTFRCYYPSLRKATNYVIPHTVYREIDHTTERYAWDD